MTRSAIMRQRARQEALKHLCAELINEADEVTAEKKVERTVASYLKLLEYRKQLREVNTTLLESSTDYARDLIDTENFDQLCLETCEKLHQGLPADHELKTSKGRSHLNKHNLAGEDGSQSPVKST